MRSVILIAAGLSRAALGHEHPTPSSTLATVTTTQPIVCTSSATATWFATTGCDIACPSTAGCIADMAVTVPCGCDRISVKVTTTTVCPTRSPCMQCHTGWGIATLRLPCPIKPPAQPTPATLD